MYDSDGERLYTRYTVLPSEHGKERSHQSFGHEIKRIRKMYAHARYVGIADGASDNWTFLQPCVQEQRYWTFFTPANIYRRHHKRLSSADLKQVNG